MCQQDPRKVETNFRCALCQRLTARAEKKHILGEKIDEPLDIIFGKCIRPLTDDCKGMSGYCVVDGGG